MAAFKECCAIGMKLISIETRTKEDCLIAYNKSVLFWFLAYNIFNCEIFVLDNLKQWRLYWTTGSDRSCAKKLHWCSGTAVATSTLDWRTGAPNFFMGKQHCLVMALRYGWTVFFKFYAADNGLNDRECWFETQYLCEE